MTLVKKGSRYLDVDGVTYRWRLRGRPTYSQGNVWGPLRFAVELAEQPGATLVVTTNQPHPSNWMGAPARPVLPSHVARAVRTALAEGWQPASPGKPFPLDQSEGFTVPGTRRLGRAAGED
ncbi:hypothetical protein [Kibdelosporangium persicum]|uniref:hypothetical protein n=1 Tax=Kibdelosporangium persicum TaxID=2698649 RepID=UPI001566E492|nr:hypothetical protein [Kibdelosporangium persicum]